MLKRKRLCWWCNGKLSAIGHAVVNGRQVHKICEAETRESFRRLTAQPRTEQWYDDHDPYDLSRMKP